MSLSLSFDIGRSALSTTAEQSSVVSRNIASSDDSRATRKSAEVVTSYGGGIRVSEIRRAVDVALFENLTEATSVLGAQDAINNGLREIESVMGGADLGRSPTALLGRVRDSLQAFSAAPSDVVSAHSVVDAASDIAGQLNRLAETVLEVRSSADVALSHSVANLNALLAKFERVNNDIVAGSSLNKDITDLLDQRDGLLVDMSEEIDIRALTRSNNDMIIFAAGGVTLFETVPRAVYMEPMPVLPAGVGGSAVFIDGIPVTDPNVSAVAAGGRIAGLAVLRDTIAPEFGRQLDEIARGLVASFAESDQSAGPGLPDQPGLFTFSGAGGIPAAGSIIDGIALAIRVNPNAIGAEGGDPFRIRDGAISDPLNPAYLYNSSGAAGFTGRINELIGSFDTALAFDPAAGLSNSQSLIAYASDSEGAFQLLRSNSAREFEYKAVLADRSREALSKSSGVNLDEEMAELLDLERSYQASSRLLQVVDSMFDSIFAATG